MDQTVYYLCRHCVGVMDGWAPHPAWEIAKSMGVPESTAIRHLRELKKQGIAKTYCVNMPCGKYRMPYWGWGITDKAKETDEYKAAIKKEKELLRNSFGAGVFFICGEKVEVRDEYE